MTIIDVIGKKDVIQLITKASNHQHEALQGEINILWKKIREQNERIKLIEDKLNEMIYHLKK